jgi:large subunit ribosomal protein L23
MIASTKKAKKQTGVSEPRAAFYDAIVAPVITEKSTNLGEQNKYVFKVRLDADKPLIKSAVESIFGVSVDKINTIKVKGKTKGRKGIMGRKSDYKKAIVTVKQGQAIDLAGGKA